MMRHLPRLRRTCGLTAAAAVLAACGNPGYNDNPSQQRSAVRPGCPAGTEFFSVHFSVHLEPLSEPPEGRISRERFRAYCEDLPEPGRVFLTVDLPGGELRTTPLGLEVIQAPAEGSPDAPDEGPVIAEMPPRTHEDGVLQARFELAEKGIYAVRLLRGSKTPRSPADIVNIPLRVGIDPFTGPWLSLLLNLFQLAPVFVVVGFLVARHLRARRAD